MPEIIPLTETFEPLSKSFEEIIPMAEWDVRGEKAVSPVYAVTPTIECPPCPPAQIVYREVPTVAPTPTPVPIPTPMVRKPFEPATTEELVKALTPLAERLREAYERRRVVVETMPKEKKALPKLGRAIVSTEKRVAPVIKKAGERAYETLKKFAGQVKEKAEERLSKVA